MRFLFLFLLSVQSAPKWCHPLSTHSHTFPLFFQRTKTLSRSFSQSCIPSGGHMSNTCLPTSLLRSFVGPSYQALQWFYLAYPSLLNSQVDHMSAIQIGCPSKAVDLLGLLLHPLFSYYKFHILLLVAFSNLTHASQTSAKGLLWTFPPKRPASTRRTQPVHTAAPSRTEPTQCHPMFIPSLQHPTHLRHPSIRIHFKYRSSSPPQFAHTRHT